VSKRALIVSALVTALVGTAAFTVTIRWSRTKSVLKQDGLAYLLYTRSLLFDLDTDVTGELDGLPARFGVDATESVERYRRLNPITGRETLPWPIGVAFFQAPFYATGMLVEGIAAGVAGRPADTLGPIPQLAFAAGTLFWSLLGFWVTVRLCREIAEPRAALLATLAAAFTGPLVFYTFFHPTMSHGVSFALVATLALWWLRLWRREDAARGRSWAWVGLVFGAMLAVRYQNLVYGLLPAALVVREATRRGLRPGLRAAAWIAAGAFLPVALEVAHLVVNHGLFGRSELASVEDAASVLGQENVRVWSPHFFDVLVSCQHGAFYWAPFLAVGFAGLVWGGVRVGRWAWVLVATILAQAYLIGTLQDISWSAAAAFGMRYLTECAPFFALGFATWMAAARTRARLSLWWGAAGVFAAANGLLIVAWSLRTISQEQCVTWPEMADGVGRALQVLLGRAG